MFAGMAWWFVSFTLLGITLAMASSPTVLWTFNATNSVLSSPAIGPDGTIYFGAGRTELYALAPDGTMKWSWRTNQLNPQVGCLAPAVAEDGTVYAAFDRAFVALTPEGTPKWQYTNANFSYFNGRGAALGADGSVFVAPASTLAKLAPDGTSLWQTLTGNSQGGWPVISVADVFYCGSYHASIYSYSTDGSRLWSMFHSYLFNFDPAIGADGTIYGSVLAGLISASPIGHTNWIFACQGDPLGSPAIDSAGDLYFGTRDGWFYAIRPNGSLKWSRQIGSRLNCSPAINREGMIYLGDQSGNFYSFTPDGTTNWFMDIGSTIESSPAIADDGTIYVGVGSTLVAIAGGSPPAESPWPMYRHDARHSGRASGDRPARPSLTARKIAGSPKMSAELDGEAGRAYTVLTSSNLQQWTSHTNLLGSTNRHAFEIGATNASGFFRAIAH